MNPEKCMGVVGVLLMVSALIIGMAAAVWAQEGAADLGEVCFRALSFDDTITIDVTQFDTPAQTPGFFTLGVHWEGRTPQGQLVYAMDGGGSAVFNPTAEVFSLDVVLRNTTSFFGDQRICHLRGTTDKTLTGHWQVTCSGKVPPTQGGTPYVVQGTLLLIHCGPPVGLPLGDVSASSAARFAVQSQGMLAGVGQ